MPMNIDTQQNFMEPSPSNVYMKQHKGRTTAALKLQDINTQVLQFLAIGNNKIDFDLIYRSIQSCI
jgi:hypothetical protein